MADPNAPIAVIGLGRFGGSLAQRLCDSGAHVLAIDADMAAAQRHSVRMRDVVCADATDATALRQLGLHAGWRAVVAIGAIQQSLLATTVLQELDVEEIWAKAISEQHAVLLRRLGAAHVVQPDADMGERMAHLLTGHLLDLVLVGDGYSVAKAPVPDDLAGERLDEAAFERRYGLKLIAVQRQDGTMVSARDAVVPLLGDVLVLWGRQADLQRFGDLG